MPSRVKRSSGFILSTVAAALVALWPPAALAGHLGHRTHHASAAAGLGQHPRAQRGGGLGAASHARGSTRGASRLAHRTR